MLSSFVVLNSGGVCCCLVCVNRQDGVVLLGLVLQTCMRMFVLLATTVHNHSDHSTQNSVQWSVSLSFIFYYAAMIIFQHAPMFLLPMLAATAVGEGLF